MDYSAGRQEDIETLISKHEARLYRTALAIMGSREDAEDVVQEAFIRAMEKAPAFESEEHEKSWLMRVTINLCRSRLRSPARSQRAELLDTYPAATPEQYELLDSISRLPPKYRTAIHMYYYERYSVKEIAELMRARESTVRSTLTRARQKLGSILKEDDDESI